MIPLDSATQAAQAAPQQVPRDFMETRARNRNTGAELIDYMWSGIEDIEATVLDPLTGSEKTRTWYGGGNLVAISAVPRVANLTISRVTIRFSGLSDRVNDLIRVYDPKYGTVILYRGFLDPQTRQFVAAARPRFVGQIDSIQFTENENSADVEVTIKNRLQDLTRTSAATKSDPYQRRRSASDTFHKYTVAIGQREYFWGKKSDVK